MFKIKSRSRWDFKRIGSFEWLSADRELHDSYMVGTGIIFLFSVLKSARKYHSMDGVFIQTKLSKEWSLPEIDASMAIANPI